MQSFLITLLNVAASILLYVTAGVVLGVIAVQLYREKKGRGVVLTADQRNRFIARAFIVLIAGFVLQMVGYFIEAKVFSIIINIILIAFYVWMVRNRLRKIEGYKLIKPRPVPVRYIQADDDPNWNPFDS